MKDKHTWLKRARSHFFFGSNLQEAKKEVVDLLDASSERYDHIHRKSTRLYDIPWRKKIFRRGAGFRYRANHKYEMDLLAKEMQTTKELDQQIKACEEKAEESILKYKDGINELYHSYKNEKNLDKKSNLKIKMQNFTNQSFYEQTAYMDANIKISSAKSEAAMKRLGQAFIEALQGTQEGVWTEVGLHSADMVLATTAFGLAVKAAAG